MRTLQMKIMRGKKKKDKRENSQHEFKAGPSEKQNLISLISKSSVCK